VVHPSSHSAIHPFEGPVGSHSLPHGPSHVCWSELQYSSFGLQSLRFKVQHPSVGDGGKGEFVGLGVKGVAKGGVGGDVYPTGMGVVGPGALHVDKQRLSYPAISTCVQV